VEYFESDPAGEVKPTENAGETENQARKAFAD
jgi:hypothetical protein